MNPLSASELRQFLGELSRAPGELFAEKASGVFSLRSDLPGPQVLIMGGVHGNERGGWQAVAELLRRASRGELRIQRGSVTFVIANLPAIEREVRFIEKNLNRLFVRGLATGNNCAETARAQELLPFLGKAEFMLDLHATTAPSPPFLMCEEHLVEDARRIGAERVVLGWAALGDSSVSGDSESFVLSCGKRAFTMENGQWCWEGSFQSAFETALRFLQYTGLLPGARSVAPIVQLFRLYMVQNKLRDGFRYARSWQTFDPISAGELIGTDGENEYRASEDSFMIMPGDPLKVTVGSDLYLLARAVAA